MNAPAAKREILVLLAGLVWSAVGIVLIGMAGYWALLDTDQAAIPLAIGILVGAAVYHFGFSRLAGINLDRIYAQAPGKDKVCVFAFQNTRSYIIVVIMMALGYTLRHLPVQRTYLVPIYLAIGLGLFLASLRYYGRLIAA